MKNLIYFNAMFDIEMGGFEAPGAKASLIEMTILGNFLGNKDDYVLIDAEFDAIYYSYLHQCGLQTPEPLSGDQRCPEICKALPWGWSPGAHQRLLVHKAMCDHPPFDVVRIANSRKFSASLPDALPGTHFCTTIAQVQSVISRSGDTPFLVKPEFGSAGFGFIPLLKPQKEFNAESAEMIAELLRYGGVELSPWCNRIHDISVHGEMHADGSCSDVRSYRCFVTKRGTFYGVYLADDDPVIRKWAPLLHKCAKNSLNALHEIGYYGWVGIDAFTFADNNNNEQCAPIVEINARGVISRLAFAVKSQVAPDKHCFLRFVSRFRGEPPSTYDELNDLLGNDAWNNQTKTGVIALLPLRIKKYGSMRPPERSGFFLAASTEEELFAMDKRLRDCLIAAKKRGAKI